MKPNLINADSELKKPCEAPVLLPNRALSKQETETYWGKDRLHLISCGDAKQALNDFYEERDK